MLVLRIPTRWARAAGLAGVAAGAALVLGGCAAGRGEAVDAAWIVAAAAGCYFLGYRYYSRFIADRVLGLDDGRATPAEVRDDGKDYVPTHRWIVFGHHFAAIAGPGPLIGPVLAAQLGYLPGLLWLVAGGILAGCVQDFVVLFCSIRRDGRTLGQMAKEQLGPLAGFTALIGVLAIMIVLLAVVALVVVRALADSPWGWFTIASTIPIAMLLGLYLRYWRPGRVEEASAVGFALVLLSVWGGSWVAAQPALARLFTFDAKTLALLLIAYGFAASTIPVWLLLAPRDYLSTFVKLGTIGMLALGIVVVRPVMQMPAVTRFFHDGMGPVWSGSVFPFLFITIACGAVSGFHSLISSGTTARLISKESHARLVGYGGMMCESVVGVMAMIAASVLTPGVYFAVNAPPAVVGRTPAAVTRTVTGWGYPVTAGEMDALTREVGEKTLYHRAGGAPTLALGIARLLAPLTRGRGVALWYHFAIMFEALFILTTLDAGTRVGRFMLQDLLGHAWEPLGRPTWWPGVLLTSGLMVAGWGYFLYAGVTDPLGGINTLWPLFGIANQMLACIALCVATTVLVRMGRTRYVWVTALPLAWLLLTTQVAAWQKVMDPSPRVGFLAAARSLQADLPASAEPARTETRRRIENLWVDAGASVFFAAVIWIVAAAMGVAVGRVLRGRAPPDAGEAEYVESRLAA